MPARGSIAATNGRLPASARCARRVDAQLNRKRQVPHRDERDRARRRAPSRPPRCTICWTPARCVDSAAAIIGTPRPICSSRVANSRSVRSMRSSHCASVDQVRQRQQVEDRDRARRRLGAVVVLLHPQQHARIAAGGAEPAAVLLVPEQFVLPPLQRDRPLEPHRLRVGLEQLEQAEDQVGVVFGIAVDLGVAVAIAAQQDARCARSTSARG